MFGNGKDFLKEMKVILESMQFPKSNLDLENEVKISNPSLQTETYSHVSK